MAKFELDNSGSNTSRFVLGVREREDGVVVGDLYTAGSYGLLEVTDGQNIPILQAFDNAADHVGEAGTVYVQDPSGLWQKEWPTLI